ncbi:MAG: hypothetical protein K2X90_01705 [Candidatus Babeliaceae bacterium]|nr:hypothetical protein [Candidatus Babeliaceae bacterium]
MVCAVFTAQLYAADVLDKTAARIVKGIALKPSTGCNTLGALGGRNTRTLLVSSENQAMAQVLYCEEEGFKSNHPRAYESLCKGTSTNKATETLINKVSKAPSMACPALGQLGRGLSSLTDAQKRKVCSACGDMYFDKHPKAKAAVCIQEENEKNEE